MDPLLRVKDLRTWFHTDDGVVRAVDGVSFQVHPGETLGVVGESGCGKSVTALSIMGLIPSPPGRIEAGSSIAFRSPKGVEELTRVGDARMRQLRGNEIGMIFQEPMTSLNPVFRVGDQIGESLRRHRGMKGREARERAMELLHLVGIPAPAQRVDEYPHQLSGGMRQRVMIAMALACDPRLLIADEPTTALDVTIQAQILALLRRLQEELEMALILITHDMGVVAEMCDRVVVMYAGQVVEEGPVDDLFHDPRNPYTEGLLRSIPHLGRRDAELAVIPGLVPPPTAWPAGCRFGERCPYAWGRCAEPPPLHPLEEGRASRCWLESEPARREAARAQGTGFLTGAEAVGAEPAPAATAPAAMAPTATAPVPTASASPPAPAATSGGSRGVALPILQVRDLKTHFPVRGGILRPGSGGVVRAVDGVSFDLLPGETLGLVGESGCGKTTIGRSILRLVDPSEGSVRFEGTSVLEMGRKELRSFRRRAQIIFQDPFSSLNPRMTVGDALREVLTVHGLARGPAATARIAELLDRVGLRPEQATRYPHEFSGGQRQRIGIARALAVEPDLIVCDEPVSALDVSVQAQVINLLQALQDELDLTYLFIAHDLSVVRHISDRVAVMYLGRIVEMAEVDALYRNPLMPYTRALLSAVPVPDPRRRPERIILKGDVPSPTDPPSGCPFHPRCPHPGKDERCTREVPPLEDKGGGHFVACLKVSAGQGGEPPPEMAGLRGTHG
jgi:peptide/nickel transport system ATP-binding protein